MRNTHREYQPQDHENQQQKKQTTQSTFSLQRLSKIQLNLTQTLELNTNLRMKYPDQPDRFYQSEQQLNTFIQQLSQLSQQHLNIIVESKLLLPLIKILQHPNIDLSIGIIQFLFQLYEQQPTEDRQFELYYRLGVWLIENGLIEAISSVLMKLDEENNLEEYEAGLQILKLFEILGNLHDSAYDVLGEDKRICEYLANRILPNFVVSHKIIDDNKYVASDILISLLTNSQKAQITFSSYSGIEVLLQTISSYQSKLPQHTDQKQFLNNLFSCLSVLLINFALKNNKKVYHQMKGNYLMINFLKAKSEYSPLALKVIANSLTALDKQSQTQAVHGVINDGGLKYIFPILKRKGVKAEDIDDQKAIDQHCLLIVYSIVRSSKQIYRDRVEYKLIQNRYENLQRLFQLRNEYAQNIGKQLEEQISQPGEYLSKLSQGLSFIEIIDKIVLIMVEKYSKLKSKIKNLMEIYGVRVKDIQKVINQHYKYLGNLHEKQWVEHMLSKNLIELKEYSQKLTQPKIQQN